MARSTMVRPAITTDSHVSFTLPSGSNASYYIIFREYWVNSAKFRVDLSGKAPTYQGVPKVRLGPNPFTNPAYKIKPNPLLSGSLGRLIFSFPEKGARGEVDILPVGTATAPRRVILNQQTLLPPGEYDVALNGTTLQRVLVRSRMDAVVRVGALKIVAADGADLFDANRQRKLMRLTSGIIVLPIGQYTVGIGGVFKQVVIVEGEVFDG